jgi:hypothetical protein
VVQVVGTEHISALLVVPGYYCEPRQDPRLSSPDWGNCVYLRIQANHWLITIQHLWEEGYCTAKLVKVSVEHPSELAVLVVDDTQDGEMISGLPGEDKARLIKNMAKFLGIDKTAGLMSQLGGLGKLLCVREMHDVWELLIPN